MSSHFDCGKRQCWSCAYWAAKKAKKSGLLMGDFIETDRQGTCMCEKTSAHYGKKTNEDGWCHYWQMDGTVSMAIAEKERQKNEERLRRERQQAECRQREEARKQDEAARRARMTCSSDYQGTHQTAPYASCSDNVSSAERLEKQRKFKELNDRLIALGKEQRGLGKLPLRRAIGAGGICFSVFFVSWVPSWIVFGIAAMFKSYLEMFKSMKNPDATTRELISDYENAYQNYTSLALNLMWIPFAVFLISVGVVFLVYFHAKNKMPIYHDEFTRKLDKLKKEIDDFGSEQ